MNQERQELENNWKKKIKYCPLTKNIKTVFKNPLTLMCIIYKWIKCIKLTCSTSQEGDRAKDIAAGGLDDWVRSRSVDSDNLALQIYSWQQKSFTGTLNWHRLANNASKKYELSNFGHWAQKSLKVFTEKIWNDLINHIIIISR